MGSGAYQEKVLQGEIAEYLESKGWFHSPTSKGYHKERAIFPEDVLAWLQDTDPQNYALVVPQNQGDAARQKGEETVLKKLTDVLSDSESNGGGMLNVLRKGFSVPRARRPFQMMQYAPETDLGQTAMRNYGKNRLRVVQEVVYSTRKSDRIDLVLFLNGLPMATIEIKTEYTQNLHEAITQYKKDRQPKGEPLLTPMRGALVHFALTEDDVYMTTALNGDSTFFLPFNQGNDNGAGNPRVVGEVATSYFWKNVLQKDAWIDIIAKFIYVNHQTTVDPTTSRTKRSSQIRFPRYHQWRAVTKILRAAREEGPGHKYLIQHSAGSGKTDSIAWTAHRLATLHREDNSKVFDTVFVIADRSVLDRQLQDAVQQLQRTDGQFRPITSGPEGSKTKQLVEALTTGVPIIGVTLQTFPYALQKIREEGGAFRGKHFAVIADEAHSSQTGNAAAAVKDMLYSNDPTADQVPFDDDDDAAAEPGADQDALNMMAAQADDAHRISYFAFTATPKEKTLALFGRPDESGKPQPFDLYSMKQAIEEGFILDVLQNYTTYEMAARIAHKAELSGGTAASAEEEVDVRTGTRALINFVELHDLNIATKVELITEHYLTTIKKELGGRAKAMVVTDSRAAAVKYQRAFEKRIAEKGLPLKTLVAFSGSVPDPDVSALPGAEVPEVTEASMNPEARGGDLAEVFKRDDQNILVVASKYQTGFDQPLLVAMYVDKKLSGIAAVQTLSRLNRRADGKDNTYVLDFVNEPQTILASFQEYYEDATVETGSDPNLVDTLRRKLDAENIYWRSEVDGLWKAWTAQRVQRGLLDTYIRPAVDRYVEQHDLALEGRGRLTVEQLEDWRAALGAYVKAYAFLSQILNYGDPQYLKLSVYADLLSRRLRALDATESREVVTADDVVLTHYRLAKQERADMRLESGGAQGLTGMTELGLTRSQERERAAKSELIEKVNEIFDAQHAALAVVALEHMTPRMCEHAELRQQARNNTKMDFAFSPHVRVKIEDELYNHEHDSLEVIKTFRELSDRQMMDLFMAAGLYEQLRGEAG